MGAGSDKPARKISAKVKNIYYGRTYDLSNLRFPHWIYGYGMGIEVISILI